MKNICFLCEGTEFSSAVSTSGENTPYLVCGGCGVWAQFPEKSFKRSSVLLEDSELSENYKLINQDLAERLAAKHKPESVLDIGPKSLHFTECFKGLGINKVISIDDCETKKHKIEKNSNKIVGDFLSYNFNGQKFDLITLVHSIERFKNPVSLLKKIKSILTDKGVVYVRTPLSESVGLPTHLKKENYKKNSIIFSKKSFKALCKKEGFVIFDEWEQPSLGQIDWQFKIADDIRVSFAVISHNEEKIIGRMLDSLSPIAWEVVVYLNNCSDNTPQVIKDFSKRTGIKIKIIEGFWDNNFARAKNEAIMACGGTHVAWMDCDDVLSPDAPEKIIKLLQEKPDHPQDWRLIYGGDTFFHLRLWKNEARDDGKGNVYKPHFHDKCHEYVQLGAYGNMKIKCDTITLKHIPQPKDASGRNIEILTEAEKVGPTPCPYCPGEFDGKSRTLFYLGNGLREAGRYEEALKRYDTYLINNMGWHDERFWAWMYKGQCHQGLNQKEEALKAYCQAIATNSHWAEPYLAIARMKYQEGADTKEVAKFQQAISWAVHAATNPIPNTLMFLNMGAYKDQPWRLISWCWEHLGDFEKALNYGIIAKEKIGGEDQSWDDRLNRLRTGLNKSSPPVSSAANKIVQICRPGALGDIIMSTAACKGLKEQGYYVRYVCHPSSIEAISDNPFVDEVITVVDNNYSKIVEATKNLEKPEKFILMQYPMNEGYPDKPMQKHLSHYFCEQAGVPQTTDLSLGLTQEHLNYGAENGFGKVVVHTTAGWSPLKNWPINWYEKLAKMIKEELGLDVIQIGAERDVPVGGITKLVTPSIKHAAAVQKFCTLFIGGDSVFNHTSRAMNKRSIIIWGSTHPLGSGYDQNINLVNGEKWTRDMGNGGPTKECQPCYKEFNHMSVHPKPPCPNLVAHDISTLPREDYPEKTLNSCMSKNTVNLVWKYTKELLS